MIRLLSIRFIAVCATLLCSVAALAYPLKPVRMIVPYPPGGGTDIMARVVAAKLSEIWGMQMFVDIARFANDC
jgi:tripartite-type tricarboxylate transporter receptor subunit TctC